MAPLTQSSKMYVPVQLNCNRNYLREHNKWLDYVLMQHIFVPGDSGHFMVCNRQDCLTTDMSSITGEQYKKSTG